MKTVTIILEVVERHLAYLEHTEYKDHQSCLVDICMWLCDFLHCIQHWSCMDRHMHKD